MQLKIGFRQLVAEAEERVKTLVVADLLSEQQRQGLMLIDLRDIRELWREGTIPGSVHVPRGMLEFWIDPEQPVGLSMNWLQIRLIGPYFSSFSTNSYGYYSQTSQNLTSISQIFASALIVRQTARAPIFIRSLPTRRRWSSSATRAGAQHWRRMSAGGWDSKISPI